MSGFGLLDTSAGGLEWAEFGTGEPVTVFAHGLGQSIATTRPFASGVPGRRVFFQFRGHGASVAPPGEWTYGDLAAELLAVADHAGASRAVGVSMGAGALCALLTEHPGRFERVVLALPAALDRARAPEELARSDAIADLIDCGDVTALADALAREQAASPDSAPAVAQWAVAQARWLLDTPAVARAFRQIPRRAPVGDAAALARVRVPVLVIAHEEDPVHPVGVARDIAATIPHARLAVLPSGGLLWAHRVTLRRLLTEFLAASAGRDVEGTAT